MKPAASFLLAAAVALAFSTCAQANTPKIAPPKYSIEGTWVLSGRTDNGIARTPVPGRNWLRISKTSGAWSVSGAMANEPGLKVRVAETNGDSKIVMVFAYDDGESTKFDCMLSGDRFELRCARSTSGTGLTTGEVVFDRRV